MSAIEYSMRQVAHRMVDFVAALIDEGMIEEGEKSQILYDELVYGRCSFRSQFTTMVQQV